MAEGAIRVAPRRAPPFHVPRRCHLILLAHRPPSPRYSSDFSRLRNTMMTRLPPYAPDYITLRQTRSLKLILADFLPFASKNMMKVMGRKRVENVPLSPTHHLVYFPNVPQSSLLLPDGTDSWHSPGLPFTRRLWAGGRMTFREDIETDGQPFHSTESIDGVKVTGEKGNEKVFVRIERGVFAGSYPGQLKGPSRRKRVAEQWTLVFMRDNRKEGCPAVSQPRGRVFKPTQTPDFFHTMVPTRELLFQFSALTLNAHAIHLDRQFCRETEGHRNLVVQGPLTVILMIEVLQIHLQNLANGVWWTEITPDRITDVAYRNLIPLYADEEMKICVKVKEKFAKGVTIWDVWIEGLDGGYAVKGLVTALPSELHASRTESIIPGTQRASSGHGSSSTESIISGTQEASSGHGSSCTESIISRYEKTFHRHRIAPQGKFLGRERIPKEQTAFQKEILESETVSDEKSRPKEKTEMERFIEAEVKAAQEAEENATQGKTLGGESIPEEQAAFQKEILESETVSDEKSRPKEEDAEDGKTEMERFMEAEVKAAQEAEENAP